MNVIVNIPTFTLAVIKNVETYMDRWCVNGVNIYQCCAINLHVLYMTFSLKVFKTEHHER